MMSAARTNCGMKVSSRGNSLITEPPLRAEITKGSERRFLLKGKAAGVPADRQRPPGPSPLTLKETLL
jgi:hypothetical protein